MSTTDPMAASGAPARICGSVSYRDRLRGALPGPPGLLAQGGAKPAAPGVAGAARVSIVTVCLNAAATIQRTIDSVAAQTYRDVEYLVIDGGSDDGTVALLEHNAKRISYFVSQKDTGIYDAMNRGLALATGTHILFLNADDWYEPDCVETLVAGLAASGAGIACALARRVDRKGRKVDVIPSMPFDASVRFGMSLRHELMLVPASLYEQLGGYDTQYRIVADFEFAIRLFDAGVTVYEARKPLLNFRNTGVSNTNWQKLWAEYVHVLARQFPRVSQEWLSRLADPREYSVELLDAAIAANPDDAKFVESLIAYGYRRGFYGGAAPPRHRPRPPVRVSVIIPVFRAEATIERCLASVLAQAVDGLEIVCVDDATPDRSAELIRALQRRDARIRLIANAENAGVAVSRNRGIAAASGEYLMFVDADDELCPGAIALLLESAERHHVDMVRGAFVRVQSGGQVGSVSGLPPGNRAVASTTLAQTQSLLRTSEGFWSCLYRASFLRNCHFAPGIAMGEDSLFLILCLTQARSVTWIPQVVYRYWSHEASAMKNFDEKKFIDAIEWREQAWRLLVNHGLQDLADWYAFRYWDPRFFEEARRRLDEPGAERVQARLEQLLTATRYRRSAAQFMRRVGKSPSTGLIGLLKRAARRLHLH